MSANRLNLRWATTLAPFNISAGGIMQGQPAVPGDLPRGTRIVVYCRTGARSNSTIPSCKNTALPMLLTASTKDQVPRFLAD